MKKFLIFIFGIITGVVLTFMFSLAVSDVADVDNGITMFEKRGDMMPDKSYQIFQAIDDNHALANALSNEEYGWYNGMVVMILGDKNSHFYDELIVKTTSGKRFYQVGTYKYITNAGSMKTVPVVTLLDRK